MSRIGDKAFKGSTFTLAIAGIAIRAVSNGFRAFQNRLAVTRLTDLDDRALKDIGLLRTDVAAALALPLHQDPSRHLVSVAGEKRGAFSEAQAAACHRVEPARLRRPDVAVTAVAAARPC
jgi:uncharacterized protein YjiS (DUF1127 family)